MKMLLGDEPYVILSDPFFFFEKPCIYIEIKLLLDNFIQYLHLQKLLLC